jgi:nicotinate-nucleotide adenylyltransferase
MPANWLHIRGCGLPGSKQGSAPAPLPRPLQRCSPCSSWGNFVWIMGADSFAGLHHWNDWREIPATLPLAVFARPGWSLKALGSPAALLMQRYRIDASDAAALASLQAPAWVFLNMPLRHESSTAIRANGS